MNSPENETSLRRELSQATAAFVCKVFATRHGDDDEDTLLRRVATMEYRYAVERAARHNVANSLAWHTLALWTEEGKERIGLFARALDCCRAEAAARTVKTPAEIWSEAQMEAECLFEIGRVHFYEGAPDAAREFFTAALPLACRANTLRAAAAAKDDRLEGRIAELLLQLPDEDEA